MSYTKRKLHVQWRNYQGARATPTIYLFIFFVFYRVQIHIYFFCSTVGGIQASLRALNYSPPWSGQRQVIHAGTRRFTRAFSFVAWSQTYI